MTVAASAEINGMKREETLLNLLCIAVGAGLLALVLYNLIAAGSIFTTDGLFMIVVPLVLALPFLFVPAQKLVSRRLEKRALKNSGAPQQISAAATQSGSPGVPALKSAPALKDVKGRPMPPDVTRIMAEINAPRAKESQ